MSCQGLSSSSHQDLRPEQYRACAWCRVVAPLLAWLLVSSLWACRGDSTNPVEAAAVALVRFTYLAPAVIDPAVERDHSRCVASVASTHIHASWRGWTRVEMRATAGDRWETVFSDVPLEEELAVRLNDPNACARHPHGATTENLFANDVRLVRIVETPGPDHGVTLNPSPDGTPAEPGLAFSVAADHSVIP